MLKIKDSVNLLALEKYGFEKKEYVYVLPIKNTHANIQNSIVIPQLQRVILICSDLDNAEYEDINSHVTDIDVVYDMICDNLVEKVKDPICKYCGSEMDYDHACFNCLEN